MRIYIGYHCIVGSIIPTTMLIVKNIFPIVILCLVCWFALDTASPWYSVQETAKVTDIVWQNGSASISFCTDLQYCSSTQLSKNYIDAKGIVVGGNIEVMILNMYANGSLWMMATLISKLIVAYSLWLIGYFSIRILVREIFGSHPN